MDKLSSGFALNVICVCMDVGKRIISNLLKSKF